MTDSGPPPRSIARGIGGAAALIAGLTIAARVVGFGRQLAFAHTVGSSCLGSAYATANQVPNIIYDIVLGGALTSAVVPVLAGPAMRRVAGEPGADADASRIASALLTWTVVLLLPLSAVLALTAGPLVGLLLGSVPHCPQSAVLSVSTRMLVVFAPQILLYGLAVVLYGMLQAHHRFTAPALAPVLSSLVVIGAYVAFRPLGFGYRNRLLADLPMPAELVLSVGTTAGVAALALTALWPVLRLRLRLRPAFRFPDGVASRVRGLAAVGFAVLVTQDAAAVAVIVLANSHGGQGALVLYNYGWQMFFLPYAVLAVPIATSAFPVLSASKGEAFDSTAASSTRGVMRASWFGAALLAGVAIPASRLFAAHPYNTELALAFAAFAPGLVGYGLAANLSRVLFASGRTRVAATAMVGGWLLVIAADVVAVSVVPARWVVPALGLGNSAGLTVAGVALLGAVRSARGGAALRGCRRAVLAGLAGAVAGVLAGVLVSTGIRVAGFFPNAAVSVLAGGCVVVAFGVAALVLDGADLRALAGRAWGRLAR